MGQDSVGTFIDHLQSAEYAYCLALMTCFVDKASPIDRERWLRVEYQRALGNPLLEQCP